MKTFTTGQVAKICKVAPRTVSKWFDTGRLKGYRVPGSQYRRIPRECLVTFLKEHGMPLETLEEDLLKVMIVSHDSDLMGVLERELSREPRYRQKAVASGFEAGIELEKFRPAVLIVDYSIGQVEANLICKHFRKNMNLADVTLIAVSLEGRGAALKQVVIDEVFSRPFDSELLAARVKHYLNKKGYRIG